MFCKPLVFFSCGLRRRPTSAPRLAAVEVAQRLGLAESEAAAQAENDSSRPSLVLILA